MLRVRSCSGRGCPAAAGARAREDTSGRDTSRPSALRCDLDVRLPSGATTACSGARPVLWTRTTARRGRCRWPARPGLCYRRRTGQRKLTWSSRRARTRDRPRAVNVRCAACTPFDTVAGCAHVSRCQVFSLRCCRRPPPSMPEAPAAPSPAPSPQVVDNEYVRVAHSLEAVGHESRPHGHERARSRSSWMPASRRFVTLQPEERRDTERVTPGYVIYDGPAVQHVSLSTSTTDLRIIQVGFKKPASTAAGQRADDPVAVAPSQFSVLVDSPQVRVLRWRLRPGEQHAGVSCRRAHGARAADGRSARRHAGRWRRPPPDGRASRCVVDVEQVHAACGLREEAVRGHRRRGQSPVGAFRTARGPAPSCTPARAPVRLHGHVPGGAADAAALGADVGEHLRDGGGIRGLRQVRVEAGLRGAGACSVPAPEARDARDDTRWPSAGLMPGGDVS